MEDEQIVGLFWDRSEEAIRALTERYGRLIRRVIRNILTDPQDVEECESDTYLGVWNRIPPQRPEYLSAYVCRIARNRALSRFRGGTAQKRGPVSALEELDGSIFAPSAEEHCSARELGRAIDAFLDTLDRDSRVIFLRRYWFSDSLGDIGRDLGLTENHAAVKLSRTRKKLKNYLMKEGYVE